MAQKLVNFYATLEVRENDDEATIKKSYRSLVLKWHPDKNPVEREKAEAKIRDINAAYAVLSNPTKREKYDLQRCAMDNRHRGKTAKPRVNPKMECPKEFMMQPLGHPEKFVRHDSKIAKVEARTNYGGAFKEFFEGTKMSLWWIPDVNNTCRIRALGSKVKGDRRKVSRAGLAGGLNFTFQLSDNAASDVRLTPAQKGKKSESVDFVVKESPEYDGAYRFETACRRGHYLAYVQPGELKVVNFLEEDSERVLDFMLVDFSAMLSFKDLEEVLVPVADPHRGTWLPLAQLQEASEVKMYFQKVLKKPVWDADDFQAYFDGHWADWEYNVQDKMVRLRPTDERLGHKLRSANDAVDVSIAVLSAGEELGTLPLVGALRAIKFLSADTAAELQVERLKLLRALPDALSEAAKPDEQAVLPPLSDILSGAEGVPGLCMQNPTPDIFEHKKAAVRTLCDLAVLSMTRAVAADKGKQLKLEDLLRLLRLPGASTHDADIAKACAAALGAAGRAEQLQVAQRATLSACPAVTEVAVSASVATLDALEPDAAAAAIAALVRAGGRASAMAAALGGRSAGASAGALAATVLALCEKGVSDEALHPIALCLSAKTAFGQVGHDTLLALAVATNKHQALGPVLEPVLKAVVATVQSWSVADLIRFLLAIVRQKEIVSQAAKEALLESVAELVVPRFSEVSVVDVVKMLLALVGLGASAFLEAAAGEAAARLPDMSPAQLLLTTQGLAEGLDPGHSAVKQALDYWSAKYPLNHLAVLKKRTASGAAAFTQGEDELSAEQLVKLVLIVAPVMKSGKASKGSVEQLSKALGEQLVLQISETPETSRMALKSELAAEGCLFACPSRSELLASMKKVARAPSPSRKGDGFAEVLAQAKKKRKKQQRKK